VSFGQQEKLQAYENPDIGIRFHYPSEWGTVIEKSSCQNHQSCVLASDEFLLGKFSKEDCNCSSLKDYLKFMYKTDARKQGFSFINDNQTIVGKNYSGWQMEYSTLDNGNRVRVLDVMSSNNGNFYAIETAYSNESSAMRLPEFKKLIESIEFIPIQLPKTPSFMNANETEQSKPSPFLESSSNGLEILSHNSFTDSIGTMHVVGEVQNNSPTTATFVKVIGTFYDTNDRVVATDFTYTNPSDIGAEDKAPFDLTLTSASVPVSQIDHYNLVASSQ